MYMHVSECTCTLVYIVVVHSAPEFAVLIIYRFGFQLVSCDLLH